eukprot:6397481-Prymnesium_polylepis.2
MLERVRIDGVHQRRPSESVLLVEHRLGLEQGLGHFRLAVPGGQCKRAAVEECGVRARTAKEECPHLHGLMPVRDGGQ